MSAIDQDRRDAWWQPLPDGYRVRPAHGDVFEPAVVIEANPRHGRIVVAVGDRAMAHHVPAEELSSRVLTLERYRRGAQGARNSGHQAGLQAVRSLPQPAAEFQAIGVEKLE